MLCLQRLLLIGSHALLAQDLPIFLLLPVRGEVSAALGTDKGLHTQEGRAAFPWESPRMGVRWENRTAPPCSQHCLLHPGHDSNKLPHAPSEQEGRSQQINGFSGQRCIKVQPHSGQELSILGEIQEKSCPRDRTTWQCWDQLYKTIKSLGSWWLSRASQQCATVTPCQTCTGRAQAQFRPTGR